LIADFRFWIGQNNAKRLRIESLSGNNRKSKIQNRKLVGIVAFVITFVMCGVRADAQQAKKIPRIGFLSAGSSSTYSLRDEAFRQGLRDLGYAEGKNIIIEYRFAEGKVDASPI
jgi:hypothetical protein